MASQHLTLQYARSLRQPVGIGPGVPPPTTAVGKTRHLSRFCQEPLHRRLRESRLIGTRSRRGPQHHLMTSSSQLPIAIDRASGGRAGAAGSLARAPFSHKQRSIRDFKLPKINANSQRPKTADATKFRWRRSIP